jgi:hypothetical protein
MRELTFKGYLLSQLCELSGLKSTSLYAFSALARDNARLKDTLSLYLVMYTENSLKNKLLKKFDYMAAACERLCGLNGDNMELLLQTNSLSEYKTVYDNFIYSKSHKEQENKIKLMMHRKIMEVKQAKHITNYRIYNELKLNAGNANAFLKNGDPSKVSLDTARKILSFVNRI